MLDVDAWLSIIFKVSGISCQVSGVALVNQVSARTMAKNFALIKLIPGTWHLKPYTIPSLTTKSPKDSFFFLFEEKLENKLSSSVNI